MKSIHHIPATMMVCAIVAAGLLVAPAAGQDELSYRLSEHRGPLTVAHAAHADLHRGAPADPANALVALERSHPADAGVAVLCRAAELALTAGLLSEREDQRVRWFREGERYAREAMAKDPSGIEPLFYVAAAQGLIADYVGVPARIDAANEVLEHSRRILEIEPGHAGALHMRGRLSAAAMRVNPVVRFVARRVMGSEVLGQASWKRAESDFRSALAAEPRNPVHRIELAALLRDTGRHEEARAQLRRVVDTNRTDALSEYYRDRARTLLSELR